MRAPVCRRHAAAGRAWPPGRSAHAAATAATETKPLQRFGYLRLQHAAGRRRLHTHPTLAPLTTRAAAPRNQQPLTLRCTSPQPFACLHRPQTRSSCRGMRSPRSERADAARRSRAPASRGPERPAAHECRSRAPAGTRAAAAAGARIPSRASLAAPAPRAPSSPLPGALASPPPPRYWSSKGEREGKSVMSVSAAGAQAAEGVTKLTRRRRPRFRAPAAERLRPRAPAGPPPRLRCAAPHLRPPLARTPSPSLCVPPGPPGHHRRCGHLLPLHLPAAGRRHRLHRPQVRLRL